MDRERVVGIIWDEVLEIIQTIDNIYIDELIKSGYRAGDVMDIFEPRMIAIEAVRANRIKAEKDKWIEDHTYTCHSCGAVYHTEKHYCDACHYNMSDR